MRVPEDRAVAPATSSIPKNEFCQTNLIPKSDTSGSAPGVVPERIPAVTRDAPICYSQLPAKSLFPRGLESISGRLPRSLANLAAAQNAFCQTNLIPESDTSPPRAENRWKFRAARAVAALAIACAFAPVLAADASSYRKAAHDVGNNLGVQQSLPEDSTLTDAPKSHPMDGSRSDVESGGGVPSLSLIWDQLKWVVLALVVAGVLGFLASHIAETRRLARSVPASLPAAGPEPGRASLTAEQLLAEADAFAGQGRYRDAMHSVLLAAMLHLARRFHDGAPDSATSREMLRAAQLEPSETAALRDLVTRADRAWFGEYPSDANDYAGARHCFESFLSGGEPA